MFQLLKSTRIFFALLAITLVSWASADDRLEFHAHRQVDGKPVACRVHLKDAAGKIVLPPGVAGVERSFRRRGHDVARSSAGEITPMKSSAGRNIVPLRAGFEVCRGRWEIAGGIGAADEPGGRAGGGRVNCTCIGPCRTSKCSCAPRPARGRRSSPGGETATIGKSIPCLPICVCGKNTPLTICSCNSTATVLSRHGR